MRLLDALAGARLPARRLRALSPLQQRQQSSSASQSPKIRAAPFLLEPSEAAKRLHVLALLISSNKFNRVLGGILGGLGLKIDGIARKLGIGESVEMTTMKAIYWPIWRVDALLEGLVNENGKGNRAAFIMAKGIHMPGHSYAPLSHLSFAEPILPYDLPKYNPRIHLGSLGGGYEIAEVPFSVSPFAVLKEIRRAAGKRGQLHSITVDEARWKEVMIACYPVMFPIYVAEFEQKRREGDRRFTVIMDGHDSDTVSCRASWPHHDNTDIDTYYANPSPFIPISHFTMPQTVIKKTSFPLFALDKAYTAWLAPPPSLDQPTPPSPLTSMDDPIDWDDPRIHSWSSRDRIRNGDYCDISRPLWNRMTLLDSFQLMQSRTEVGTDPEVELTYDEGGPDERKLPAQPLSKAIKLMEKDTWSLQARWKALKPKWLVDWEDRKIKAGRVWEKRSDGLSSSFPSRLSR